MPTTVFLSIRGEGASRMLESFRRTLGDDAASLVVVPTNDDNGYHGSAEVADVVAAREAFALARTPFPAMKAYLSGMVRAELPPRHADHSSEPRPARGMGPRPRGPERPQEPRGRAPERVVEAEAGAESAEREQRRTPLRGRNRNQRRQAPGEAPAAE